MNFWQYIVAIIILAHVAINIFVYRFLVDDDQWCVLPELFNPVTIYKNHKVNYFGALMICLGFTILFPTLAIGYWIYCLLWLFYKLCTIGRK